MSAFRQLRSWLLFERDGSVAKTRTGLCSLKFLIKASAARLQEKLRFYPSLARLCPRTRASDRFRLNRHSLLGTVSTVSVRYSLNSVRRVFRVIVPTRNSVAWIGILLEAYRAYGIEPLYILDARSGDGTKELLAAMNADVVPFWPSGDFVEAGMIAFGANAARTEWVLRLDDDEFPSEALIHWIGKRATHSVRPGWFLSRRDLFVRDGVLSYNCRRSAYTHPGRPDFLGGHSRLFRPRQVDFPVGLHTSGVNNEEFFGFAPQSASFVHLTHLLRSPSERLAKIRKYEQIQKGSTWRLADEYLPELFDWAHLSPKSDGLAEFAPLLARLPQPTAEPDFRLEAHELDFAVAEVAKWTATVEIQRQQTPPYYSGNHIELARYLPGFLGVGFGYLCSLIGRISHHPRLRSLGKTIRRLAIGRSVRPVSTRDGKRVAYWPILLKKSEY